MTRRARSASSEFLANHNRLNAACVQFLKVDLETGLILSGLAFASTNTATRERNTKNARKAYDTILRLMDKFELTESDANFIDCNLQRLKSHLVVLGESFDS
jgi:hypothetical protein